MIILFVIVTDDQEKLIPYLMEKFQEYQPLIMEFLNNMRKDKKTSAIRALPYNSYTYTLDKQYSSLSITKGQVTMF